MQWRELQRLPNLLSLSRIALAPLVVYFVQRSDAGSVLIAGALYVIAGLTDGLDGYLARRMKCVTPFGTALDPVADKIFAVILIVGLILFREFPLWLATLIIGRDILIIAGGTWLLRGRAGLILPSNLTGKWAFAAVAVLLGAHVIKFNFSIGLMTPIVTVLLIVSLINYGRLFLKVHRGENVEPFRDRPAWRAVRLSLAGIVAAAHLLMFWVEFLR